MTATSEQDDHAADDIVALYERHAAEFDKDRRRILFERGWLDRFLASIPSGGAILDLGCGMGEPMARHMIAAGYSVTGVDSSAAMIALCRQRFPDHAWIVADMRSLALAERFAGIIAWNSFFHLTPEAQRQMFARFAAHAASGAPLMVTSGPAARVALGAYHGDPLYHASLDEAEYRALLAAHGFDVVRYVPDDPECEGHTVWLAQRKRLG